MEEEFFIIRYRGSAENRNAIYDHLTGVVTNSEQYSALLKDMDIGRAKTMHDILDLPQKPKQASPPPKKIKEEVEDVDEKYMERVTYHSSPGEGPDEKTVSTAEEKTDKEDRMPTLSRESVPPPVLPQSSRGPRMNRAGVAGYQGSEGFTSHSKHNQAARNGPYAEYLAQRRRRPGVPIIHSRHYTNFFDRKPETISSQMLKLHNIRIERRS
ncbi:unnamed protein product [Caenorhabditis brenneri]